jgi:hypothetical protein
LRPNELTPVNPKASGKGLPDGAGDIKSAAKSPEASGSSLPRVKGLAGAFSDVYQEKVPLALVHIA